MVLLWIPHGLKLCARILDHLKEDVMKIQQQNTRKTVLNLKKDQEHIAGLHVKLNALVSMFHIYSPFFIISFISLLSPNFRPVSGLALGEVPKKQVSEVENI